MDPAVPNFENSVVRIAFLVPNLDPMLPLYRNLIHLIGNSVISIPGQAVDTGSYQKMSSNLLSDAKELIDVGFPIADMDASPRIIKQLSGLLEIF